jgi:hypothetical protein
MRFVLKAEMHAWAAMVELEELPTLLYSKFLVWYSR